MDSTHFQIASTLGLLLGACLIAGLVADRIHFPKVTAYLLVGLVAGPSVFDWLPPEHVHSLDTVTKLAMALVLFNLGCHFPLDHIRRIFRRTIFLSAGELIMTFVLVAIGLLLLQQSWEVALLLAALALATAPATTVLVLKESASEGPVTEHASTLVALNNFASILIFEAVFICINLMDGSVTNPIYYEFGYLALCIVGSVTLGLMTGFAVSYGCGLLKQSQWLVLLLALTTIVLGICESFDIPYMLAFLAMGLMVVNSSDLSSKITAELDRLTGLLCVLFFVIHGAELDLGAFLTAGVVGGVYILCRSMGKVTGTALSAHLIGESPQVRHWLGPSLLAQAGAAIALSAIAVQRNPELGRPIQTVILGSVVVFEIVGPIVIRQSILRAGEVPLAQAIHHATTTPIGQLGQVWNRLLSALGWDLSSRRSSSELMVSDLMRKNVEGIPTSANFDEVVQFIERSHDNSYPVLDERRAVVGQICYSLLSSALFDRAVGSLVRAEDLATCVNALLYPDDLATRALELFRTGTDDCIAVVSREDPHCLVGVVRRADITKLLIRGHQKG